MIRQQIRVALLAGSLVAATALTARAEDPKPAPAAAAADACAPQYRTVCVKEWVPEKYDTTKTVYERVCREEKYTAYRCETAPETKTRQVTVYHKVPKVKEVVRHVCVSVPCVEERTVMMDKVARDGFVSGYDGRRVSRTGKLFVIRDVTVWRLADSSGESFGVAAFFRGVRRL